MLEKTKGGCGRIEIDSTKIDVVSFVFEDMGENKTTPYEGSEHRRYINEQRKIQNHKNNQDKTKSIQGIRRVKDESKMSGSR